ncbi:cysteine hydrolase family protein [Acinetobacter johnsonii]|uniref:cysteine hydrolase family protein n=1 Tax=Acinetobacter johnsonii TaxID=40214 RepID=UPI001F391E58|nr:cysteine hydrolase family protein [Acinetobacter johnsonii]UJA01812.1 isochorismatase family protein [Acinetobacter johnsonii]
MSKSALLIIDLQNEYLSTGKLPLVNIEQATENAVKVIAKARQNAMPVIHIQHISASDEIPIFVPNSNGIEFQDTVKPNADETVIVKNNINAFLNTNLKEILDTQGITELVVIGAMSHMCIDAAVRAAADFGYKVTVIHDACATLDLEFNGRIVEAAQVHAALMAALAFAYATIISTTDYIQN